MALIGKIYNGLDSLPETHRKAWEDIGDELNFFHSLAWFRIFERTIVAAGEGVPIVCVQSTDDSAPLLVLPLWRPRRGNPGWARSCRALSNYYSSSFQPVIWQRGFPLDEILDEAVDTLLGLQDWDLVDLLPIERETPLFTALERALQRSNQRVFPYFAYGNWYYEVPEGETFADYMAQRPSKLRNTFKRKYRKLQREHDVEFLLLADEHGLDEGIATFERIYKARWGKSEPFPSFIPSFVRYLASTGHLRLGILEVDSKPVAVQLWIVHNDRASIFKLAYDPEYAPQSVGTILSALMFEKAIDTDKVSCIDYLTGDDGYKKLWMIDRREMWGLQLPNARTIRGKLILLRNKSACRCREQIVGGQHCYETINASSPSAVVVGLCVHGLAVCRSLASEGVTVHALESQPVLPGVKTSSARVHIVDSLKGEGLIQALIDRQKDFAVGGELPILILINDDMVANIAANWERLKHLYRLSWDHCRETIQQLLIKTNLEARCAEIGLNYPQSTIVDRVDAQFELPRSPEDIYIVKPSRPLGSFKVLKVHSREEIDRLCVDYPESLPFLIQPWIGGDDSSLFFAALYLDDGKELANYIGQKMLSHPPAMGQTTAAITSGNTAVLEAARLFFNGLNMSGPVSLEMKRDVKGELWVIEPTIGRTDFWTDCCTENGVNLPFIEFCHQTGAAIPRSEQKHRSIWLDSERDPLILLNLLRSGHLSQVLRSKWRFSFLDRRDSAPFYTAWRAFLRKRILSS